MVRVSERRRGSVLVHVVICLGVLMAVTAVALDGGLLLDQRRRLQAAADAAALAAAADLYANYLTNGGVDTKGTAKASALATAAVHGYTSGSATASAHSTNSSAGSTNDSGALVTVNIPPQAVNDTGTSQPGYGEVIIQYNQKRGFSGIFGRGDVPVKARAVARGQWIPDKSAILLTAPRGQSLRTSGNTSLSVVGGPVVVDSNDSQAVFVAGSSALTSPGLEVTGAPGTFGKVNGPVKSGMTATPNPFIYLPLYGLSALPLQSGSAKKITGPAPVVLSPGIYKGGISITGQGDVLMQPGIYYMQAGGFSYTGQGNLTANGVMLLNAPFSPSDAITLNGQGRVTMSPMTTGLYQGFTLFQDPYATIPVTVSGNGKMKITGTIYAAHAPLNLSSNGSTNGIPDVIGSQLAVYNLTLSGNGSVAVRRDIVPTARARVIGLVE
jgi:Flp pilus assembly protein TadG